MPLGLYREEGSAFPPLVSFIPARPNKRKHSAVLRPALRDAAAAAIRVHSYQY